jgi:hypothetical protein
MGKNKRRPEEKPIKPIVKQRPRTKTIRYYADDYEEGSTEIRTNATVSNRKHSQVPNGSDDLSRQ